MFDGDQVYGWNGCDVDIVYGVNFLWCGGFEDGMVVDFVIGSGW